MCSNFPKNVSTSFVAVSSLISKVSVTKDINPSIEFDLSRFSQINLAVSFSVKVRSYEQR